MAKKKIKVKDLEINLASYNEEDYFSLTDIAKESEKRASALITSWLQNRNTLVFLETWETLKNPNFNVQQMQSFKLKSFDKRHFITPKNYIKNTNAIGLISKPGRHGGGTYAHKDIALNFCYWLSPAFQVYMILEFQRLKEEESERKNLKWHLSKITDNIDEVRNLLDTIPGQDPVKKRLTKGEEKV